VYLGAHAPLDVLGGLGLGLLVGGLANLAVGVPGADGRGRDPSDVPEAD
jgi:undecaprenyl-diphosphatase